VGAVPGSAGVPPASIWRSRGYLPHFEGGSIPQFVTFRLANSLPSELLEQWRTELRRLPEKEASAERRRRVEQWLDQGAGPTWLGDFRVASMVEEALLRFDCERYQLHAWVVMPNHVHVLLTPGDGWSLSAILHSWKSFASKRANRILGRRGKFWQEEYFDRYIRDQQHFERAVEYIEGNPAKAGLCEIKQQWPFGSATLRAGGTPALPG
jgi:REP element-mobilizing transposase RayT